MKEFLSASTIEAAARSPRGVLSLLAILITVIALIFFRDASEWVRLVVFCLLLAGVVGFGFAVVGKL